jgi:MtaA/CmuA family methyltransferase
MTKMHLFKELTKGKPMDRILFRPILMHFAARHAGYTYGELASDYKVLVRSNIKAMEDFDLDMVGLISDPYRETSAFGAPVEFIPEGVPKCKKIIISSIDDVNALKNPDVYKAERTLDRIKGAEHYQEKLKGTVPVIGWIEGPLAEACDLAGVSEMLMQLMMDPDFSNRLMDKVMVTAKDFAKAQIEAGCSVIGIGDAVCSQISADMYELFVMDRHKELIDFIHDSGAAVKMHICGNISHLLTSLKNVGMDILDLDWQVDVNDAREILGAETILCGNINPVTVQDARANELEKMSADLINVQKNQKFILSAGCEITVNTPAENLMAMRNASL